MVQKSGAGQIGHFLVQANRKLATYIQTHERVESYEELLTLGNDIQVLAQEAEMPILPMYHPPSSRELLQTLQMFSNGLEPLRDGDSILIGNQGEAKDIELCPAFRVTDADFSRLLVREEITAPAPTIMILKIRRPDFFGSSQWEFKFNGQTFKARIADKVWIAEFLAKRQPLTPGDGLRVEVISTVSYGWDNEVVQQQHVIQRVIEVIPGQVSIQEELPPGDA